MGAFIGIAAQALEFAKVVRQFRKHHHVRGARGLRQVVARVRFEHRFRCLSCRLDDIFVIGRHIVFDCAHPRIKLRRHAHGLSVALLVQHRGQIGDVALEARKRAGIGIAGAGCFVELGGDLAEAVFKAKEGRIIGRVFAGCRARIDIVDTPGNLVQPLGQLVIHRTIAEQIDLLGNIGEERRQFRLRRRALGLLQIGRELVELLGELRDVAI